MPHRSSIEANDRAHPARPHDRIATHLLRGPVCLAHIAHVRPPVSRQKRVANLHEVGNRDCIRPDRNRLLAIPQPGEPNRQGGWRRSVAIAGDRCHYLAIQLGTGLKIGALAHRNPLRRLYHDLRSYRHLASTKRSSQLHRQSYARRQRLQLRDGNFTLCNRSRHAHKNASKQEEGSQNLVNRLTFQSRFRHVNSSRHLIHLRFWTKEKSCPVEEVYIRTESVPTCKTSSNCNKPAGGKEKSWI